MQQKTTKERRIEELREIFRAQNGRVPTEDQAARMLVDKARNPSSAWHDGFTWDVQQAAERYWVIQARTWIDSYRVHLQVRRLPTRDERVNLRTTHGAPAQGRGDRSPVAATRGESPSIDREVPPPAHNGGGRSTSVVVTAPMSKTALRSQLEVLRSRFGDQLFFQTLTELLVESEQQRSQQEKTH